MPRTTTYSALVLRSRPSGESNNEIHLLTGEEGIIKATVFGGPKSKLRAYAAPYNSGKVWIYREPVKDYRKISDFDVRSWRPGLRELYERTMAAGGVAETILSSHGGGGDWGISLKIANETLDTLENANEELCSRLLAHFLWRWAGFLGFQPHIDICASCGKEIADNPAWFSFSENTAFCESCLTEHAGLLKLNQGCRRWLSATGQLEPSQIYRFSMDNKSFGEVKTLTTAIMTSALGKQLTSWDW
jgi:DNA repair protein RecO (recombination protein O)